MDRGNYEKISDQVMLIANKEVLKMNVTLSVYGKGRYPYHQEVEYYSEKANGNLINIKRHFDYYLSIETINNKYDDKNYIRIGIGEITRLCYALEQAEKFFIDPKYSDLYAKKDGELFITKRVEPIVLTGLPQGKYLMFEPSIYQNFRGELEQSLRMYISSESSYCDITLRNLEAFIYTIKNFNLFASAQNMLSYFGKPEMGYNLYSCNTIPQDEEEINFKGKDGRVPTSTKNISYFDKMKQMED